MTLMLAEVLHLPGLSRAFPGNPVAEFLSFHQSHVEWVGCSLHDLIQPAFSFLVGAALAFSVASRKAHGQTFRSMLGHAIWRAMVLIALGIALRSFDRPQTNFTFEDTLTQIGLGYVFLFLLAWTSWRVQAVAVALILAGYWIAFALYPLPAPEMNFAAHWNKNTNLAWAFDTWFLNLFPREKPFIFNGGGYSTLSFIPTLGTMLIGLLAGQWMKTGQPRAEILRGLLIGGAALLAAGLLWHFSGTCPFVKRIWTPSFTLGSAGLVLLILSGILWLTEIRNWSRWAFPLVVVGANSIAAYLLAHMFERGLMDALNRHLGRAFFQFAGLPFQPLIQGVFVLGVFWSILYWMYRGKIFLRI